MENIGEAYEKAKQLRNRGEWNEALALLTEITQAKPMMIRAFYTMATIYYDQRKAAPAAECYQKVLTDYPHLETASVDLFICLVQLKQYEAAYAELRRYVNSYPVDEYREILLDMFDVTREATWLRPSRPQPCEESVKDSQENQISSSSPIERGADCMSPPFESVKVIESIGETVNEAKELWLAGNQEKARALLDEVAGIVPENWKALMSQAARQFNHDRFDLACELFQRALLIKPEFELASVGLCLSLIRVNRFDPACDELIRFYKSYDSDEEYKEFILDQIDPTR